MWGSWRPYSNIISSIAGVSLIMGRVLVLSWVSNHQHRMHVNCEPYFCEPCRVQSILCFGVTCKDSEIGAEVDGLDF